MKSRIIRCSLLFCFILVLIDVRVTATDEKSDSSEEVFKLYSNKRPTPRIFQRIFRRKSNNPHAESSFDESYVEVDKEELSKPKETAKLITEPRPGEEYVMLRTSTSFSDNKSKPVKPKPESILRFNADDGRPSFVPSIKKILLPSERISRRLGEKSSDLDMVKSHPETYAIESFDSEGDVIVLKPLKQTSEQEQASDVSYSVDASYVDSYSSDQMVEPDRISETIIKPDDILPQWSFSTSIEQMKGSSEERKERTTEEPTTTTEDFPTTTTEEPEQEVVTVVNVVTSVPMVKYDISHTRRSRPEIRRQPQQHEYHEPIEVHPKSKVGVESKPYDSKSGIAVPPEHHPDDTATITQKPPRVKIPGTSTELPIPVLTTTPRPIIITVKSQSKILAENSFYSKQVESKEHLSRSPKGNPLEDKVLVPAESNHQPAKVTIKKNPNSDEYEYEYVYYYYDDGDYADDNKTDSQPSVNAEHGTPSESLNEVQGSPINTTTPPTTTTTSTTSTTTTTTTTTPTPVIPVRRRGTKATTTTTTTQLPYYGDNENSPSFASAEPARVDRIRYTTLERIRGTTTTTEAYDEEPVPVVYERIRGGDIQRVPTLQENEVYSGRSIDSFPVISLGGVQSSSRPIGVNNIIVVPDDRLPPQTRFPPKSRPTVPSSEETYIPNYSDEYDDDDYTLPTTTPTTVSRTKERTRPTYLPEVPLSSEEEDYHPVYIPHFPQIPSGPVQFLGVLPEEITGEGFPKTTNIGGLQTPLYLGNKNYSHVAVLEKSLLDIYALSRAHDELANQVITPQEKSYHSGFQFGEIITTVSTEETTTPEITTTPPTTTTTTTTTETPIAPGRRRRPSFGANRTKPTTTAAHSTTTTGSPDAVTPVTERKAYSFRRRPSYAVQRTTPSTRTTNDDSATPSDSSSSSTVVLGSTNPFRNLNSGIGAANRFRSPLGPKNADSPLNRLSSRRRGTTPSPQITEEPAEEHSTSPSTTTSTTAAPSTTTESVRTRLRPNRLRGANRSTNQRLNLLTRRGPSTTTTTDVPVEEEAVSSTDTTLVDEEISPAPVVVEVSPTPVRGLLGRLRQRPRSTSTIVPPVLRPLNRKQSKVAALISRRKGIPEPAQQLASAEAPVEAAESDDTGSDTTAETIESSAPAVQTGDNSDHETIRLTASLPPSESTSNARLSLLQQRIQNRRPLTVRLTRKQYEEATS